MVALQTVLDLANSPPKTPPYASISYILTTVSKSKFAVFFAESLTSNN